MIIKKNGFNLNALEVPLKKNKLATVYYFF